MNKPSLYQAEIVGTGIYLPEKVLTNADLEKSLDTSDEWILTRTGIQERRIAQKDESSSTLGAHAARNALNQAGLTPEELELIIVCTYGAVRQLQSDPDSRRGPARLRELIDRTPVYDRSFESRPRGRRVPEELQFLDIFHGFA